MQASLFVGRVGDYMESAPLCVSLHSSLREVETMLVDARVHAVPVVDEAGHCHGMISTFDLVQCGSDARDITTITLPCSADEPDETPPELTARDVMETVALFVTRDAPLEEAARVMYENGVDRVVVLDRGRLIGMITSSDLLRILTQSGSYPPPRIDFDPCASACELS
jgi:CBS domain-containing protein